MRKKPKQQDLGSLPEGLLVEILSRVPYSSLCRFKCVSRSWLALCSAPDIRKRSPQTLSGFFYKPCMTGFCNLSGRGPPMVDPFRLWRGTSDSVGADRRRRAKISQLAEGREEERVSGGVRDWGGV
jgi:hypothetical protein